MEVKKNITEHLQQKGSLIYIRIYSHIETTRKMLCEWSEGRRTYYSRGGAEMGGKGNFF